LKKTDPKTEEQIQKLYDEGFCDTEIAERVGKVKSTIGHWRKKRNLPTVFENRKRLTEWESKQIQEYLAFEQKYKRIKKYRTLATHEKGLIAFVMTLTHQLDKVSQTDVENYIIAHNTVDLTRRNELLTTNMVTKFSIPNIPVSSLFNFASRIIAKRIFYRDGGCTKCGSLGVLHLHMIKGEFNLNDENLETLCENCYRIAMRGTQI
jgi:5-methylcytosine-specific restriction endonuclease McrA